MIKRFLFMLLLLALATGSHRSKQVFTHVTCMYDIKRGDLGQFKRTFQYYLSYFDMLLKTDSNLIIFGGKDIEAYVWERRKPHNTVFVLKEIETFREFWFYPHVQRIRQKRLQDPTFPKKDHPQFALEFYNMIMFSKTYLLTYALDHDKFNSDYFIWTDGGLNHIFSKSMVYPQNHLTKLFQFLQPQWVFYTYSDPMMFQGYAQGSERYLNGIRVRDDESVLAGFFGGYIEAVRDVRCTYENFLRIILENEDMNSDESLVSMLPIKYPYLFPTTYGCGPEYLYQKIRIYKNFSRKPEHPRFFRGDFKSNRDGTITFIENKVFVKHVKIQNVLTAQNITKQVIKEVPVEIKKPNSVQPTYYQQNKVLLRIIGDNLTVYKRIFLRQGLYFLAMIVLYIVVVCNRFKSKRNFIKVPFSEQQIIISDIGKLRQSK